MDLDKEVFTTFEAADICNANITSIKNWIDQGELNAFRTPGGHYRIEREVLDDFLTRHGMPNPFARNRKKRVLVIHRADEEWLDVLEQRLGPEHEYDVAAEAVEAVLKLGHWQPDVAVVDCGVEELDVEGLCRTVREYDELRPMTMVVVCNEEMEGRAESFVQAGADETLTAECGPEEVCRVLQRALS